MNAAYFAAQLRIARITDEFYSAYVQFALNLLERERTRAGRLLGPDSDAVHVLSKYGQPMPREQLAELVERMSEAQQVAFAEAVARG